MDKNLDIVPCTSVCKDEVEIKKTAFFSQWSKVKEEFNELDDLVRRLPDTFRGTGDIRYIPYHVRAHMVEEAIDLMTALKTLVEVNLADGLKHPVSEFYDFVKTKNVLRGYVDDTEASKDKKLPSKSK